MLIRSTSWDNCRIYVEDEMLPSDLGICVIPSPITTFVVCTMSTATAISPRESPETWLTKLEYRWGEPHRYVRVCRLRSVPVRVEIEGKTIDWVA